MSGLGYTLPSSGGSSTAAGTSFTPVGTVAATDVQAAIAEVASESAAADKLGLTPTAVKTANYTAAVGDFVPCNTSGGAFTVTLPTAPADGSVIAIKLVIGGYPLSLAMGGSDVFNKAGGATTGTLNTPNQAILVQYKATGALWYVLADDLPPRLAIGGTAAYMFTTPGVLRATYVDPLITFTNGVTCYFGPFDVPAALPVDAVVINYNAVTGTSNIRIAFINVSPTTWQPTSLQYAIAEQTFTTTGRKTITFTAQTLPAGPYLIGVRTDNSTSALGGMRGQLSTGWRGREEGYGNLSHYTVSEAYGAFAAAPTAWTATVGQDTVTAGAGGLAVPVFWRTA